MTAIIYHQVKPGMDCPDGITAAWIAKKKYPSATLIGACYQSVPPDLSLYNDVIIVDFSFPLNILNGWVEEGKSVRVIDHHKTAQEDLSKFVGAVFDMKESGASLTWKVLFGDEPMPDFINYVKDRDLWDFKLPFSHEINEALGFIGRRPYRMDIVSNFSREDLIRCLAPLGEKLLEPKRKRINELLSECHDAIIKGYRVKALHVTGLDTRYISDLCTAMYKKYKDVDFVMTYTWDKKEHLWNISLRSDKDGSNFDVSEIARLFGGGGHHNAAGTKMTETTTVILYDKNGNVQHKIIASKLLDIIDKTKDHKIEFIPE